MIEEKPNRSLFFIVGIGIFILIAILFFCFVPSDFKDLGNNGEVTVSFFYTGYNYKNGITNVYLRVNEDPDSKADVLYLNGDYSTKLVDVEKDHMYDFVLEVDAGNVYLVDVYLKGGII